jgi:hypothetical protein
MTNDLPELVHLLHSYQPIEISNILRYHAGI